MTRIYFDSPDPEETGRLAAELGRSIGASGLVIALMGPLGAGKTVFVKGLADGLGVDPRIVSSPTFVIAQQYPIVPTGQEAEASPEILHHVDLYRLEKEEELFGMGFDDLFHRGAVLAVEWADRFPGVLGPARLEIEFDGAASRPSDAPGRRLSVAAFGAQAEAVLEDWQARLARGERLAGSSAGAAGRGPREEGWAVGMLMTGLLGMAATGIGLSADLGRDIDAELGGCASPIVLETDALGSSRVRCSARARGLSGAPEGSPGSGRSELSGTGGLLFGHALDLATASSVQLEALPHLGPKRASAILEARDKMPFESVEDLRRVSGIGPQSVERWAPWLKVKIKVGAAASDDESVEGQEAATPKRGRTWLSRIRR